MIFSYDTRWQCHKAQAKAAAIVLPSNRFQCIGRAEFINGINGGQAEVAGVSWTAVTATNMPSIRLALPFRTAINETIATIRQESPAILKI